MTSTNGRERLVPGVAMVPLTSHACPRAGAAELERGGVGGLGADPGDVGGSRGVEGHPRRVALPDRERRRAVEGAAWSASAPIAASRPAETRARDVNKGCDESGPSRPSLTVVARQAIRGQST